VSPGILKNNFFNIFITNKNLNNFYFRLNIYTGNLIYNYITIIKEPSVACNQRIKLWINIIVSFNSYSCNH